jgi:hypothetical protein
MDQEKSGNPDFIVKKHGFQKHRPPFSEQLVKK